MHLIKKNMVYNCINYGLYNLCAINKCAINIHTVVLFFITINLMNLYYLLSIGK